VDAGHIALVGLVIVVIIFKLRATRKRKFRVTFIVERDLDDVTESLRQEHEHLHKIDQVLDKVVEPEFGREKTPEPEGPGVSP